MTHQSNAGGREWSQAMLADTSVRLGISDKAGQGQSASDLSTRRGLAALYRAAAMFGWDDLTFTHISARIPDRSDRYLINEYGLAFNEITAANLVEINAKGEAVDTPDVDVNPAGFIIHSAVHQNRPDAHYVIHLHSKDGVAVAAQKDGLLPISQQSLMIYDSIAYHDYGGIVDDEQEQKALLADAGDKNIVILRNHGVLIMGPSPEAVFLNAYFYQTACSIQIAGSSGEINLLSDSLISKVREQKVEMSKSNSGSTGAMKAWNVVLRRLMAEDSSFLY